MKCLFRTDASLEIGSGHLMRCLALADALSKRGTSCVFAMRALQGSMHEQVSQRGHTVHLLPTFNSKISSSPFTLPKRDAAATSLALQEIQPDWLIVDHYGIDSSWEVAVAATHRLLVIDDLHDRSHNCTALVDQNLPPSDAYDKLVPADCRLMLGPEYAILRPEFRQARESAPVRQSLSSILISMGGADPDNASARVLNSIRDHLSSTSIEHITVILGASARSEKEVRQLAEEMPVPTSVAVGVTDIAVRMSEVDLAIGGGGTTSWERCCVGLPSIVISLAENQEPVAAALASEGAATYIGPLKSENWQRALREELVFLSSNPPILNRMSQAAFGLTDGTGTELICEFMLGGAHR